MRCEHFPVDFVDGRCEFSIRLLAREKRFYRLVPVHPSPRPGHASGLGPSPSAPSLPPPSTPPHRQCAALGRPVAEKPPVREARDPRIARCHPTSIGALENGVVPTRAPWPLQDRWAIPGTTLRPVYAAGLKPEPRRRPRDPGRLDERPDWSRSTRDGGDTPPSRPSPRGHQGSLNPHEGIALVFEKHWNNFTRSEESGAEGAMTTNRTGGALYPLGFRGRAQSNRGTPTRHRAVCYDERRPPNVRVQYLSLTGPSLKAETEHHPTGTRSVNYGDSVLKKWTFHPSCYRRYDTRIYCSSCATV